MLPKFRLTTYQDIKVNLAWITFFLLEFIFIYVFLILAPEKIEFDNLKDFFLTYKFLIGSGIFTVISYFLIFIFPIHEFYDK